MFQEGDVVKLLVSTLVEWDDKQVQLSPGIFGTIVAESKAASVQLVEFCNSEGLTIAMVPIASTTLELHRKAVTEDFESLKNQTGSAPKIAS